MPKIVDHRERRSAIARASWDVIAASGLGDATMRDIASAAGVTTGAITHYFANKDEILTAALELIAADTLDRVRAQPTQDVGQFLDLLALAMPTTPERLDEWRVWLAFWSRTTTDDAALRSHNQQFRSAWLAVLEERLTDLSEAGLVDLDDEAPVVASRVSHIVSGIAVESCLDPTSWPADRQTAELRAIVAPMLAPDRARSR